jgi:hypothetical protein
MTSFDSLFACVWRGEAPPEALADWVLTNLPDEREMNASYQYLNEDRLDPDWAYLNVSWLNVSRTHLFVELRVRNLEMGQTKGFSVETFASEFPNWLTEEINFVYYVLSK